MRVSPIRAITNAEFVEMMRKCRPPTGWPSTLGPPPNVAVFPIEPFGLSILTAVASSAGPDSTCLLFLLRRMIDRNHENESLAGANRADLPDAILSLHVNHDLQSDAGKMARAARAAARKFNFVHDELRGEGEAGGGVVVVSPIETVARTARYQLMFEAMVRRRVHILAAGHHADDQVETVLMRLGSGSTVLGLGGMRPRRRFGMALGKGGGKGEGEGAGAEERDKDGGDHFGLDRILATCDLHGIRYVIDRTNFQPDLTLRNAIRHVLACNERKARSLSETMESPPLPPVLAEKILRTQTASENLKLPVPFDLMASRESLYEAVRYSSLNLADIESRGNSPFRRRRIPLMAQTRPIQASTYLSRFSVQAPPGTFLLAADRLSATVVDPLVQQAMVLRILRYISPHPWGSTRAQAGRRTESLRRIIERVWDPSLASETRSRFEAGANVLWTPLRICPDGRLRHERPTRGDRFGWLASRSPIHRSRPSSDRDISTELSPPRRRAEVMYDNRFLVTFRLEDVPTGDPVMISIIEGSGKVILAAGGRWLWPQVVWRRKGEDVVIACISAPELDCGEKPRLWQDVVDFNFMRVLDDP
ncbi:hypothetical protein F5148DRAFT_1285277 [Russula earlei]|uniref:Uncharacterized protein n=1 Tax=Russula earlei TaxID=71964 RepID=A0ACC0U928_9AGAM|nr:hypothetical protein F5148DRAFT_1285277 [Russula earlei]